MDTVMVTVMVSLKLMRQLMRMLMLVEAVEKHTPRRRKSFDQVTYVYLHTCVYNNIIVHYEYMSLAKHTSVSREALFCLLNHVVLYNSFSRRVGRAASARPRETRLYVVVCLCTCLWL